MADYPDKLNTANLPPGVTGMNPGDDGRPSYYMVNVPDNPNDPFGSGTYKSWDAAGNVEETKSYPSLRVNGGGFLSGGFFGPNSLFGTLAPIAAAAYGANELGLFNGIGAGAGTKAAADAAFVAADASQLAAQGLSANQIASTLTASGVDSFLAADAAQLAAQGIGGSQLAGLLTQSAGGTPIFPAATAGGLLNSIPTGVQNAATSAAGAAAGAATGAGAGTAGSALGTGLGTSLGTSVLNKIIGGGLGTGAGGGTGGGTNTDYANLFSGLLGGAGSLMQGGLSQQAAQDIANRVQGATTSAVSGAQFRPVGITTRFGQSNFQVDPVTGQITSAGYTPSALSNQLQTGAQNVYNLGQGYVAQSPQEAAQQWMTAQQNLLAPSRDVALANLRNQQFQRGREGLAVAQGGELQAANPEMAAYYNSLANQNAQLAANAQQFGQQQAQFGTGLLGSGLNLMGGIESMAQQPFTLGTGLGQQSAAAGANAGRLGLTGTGMGTDYLYKAATYSPVSNILTGASTSPMASNIGGQLLGSLFGNWSNMGQATTVPNVYGGGSLPIDYANL